jgi:putative ABC transport system permease protein
VLDVSRVREVIEGVLGRVAQAVRFLAVFAAAAGGLVLAGALATSRQQRAREGALLRTLGARRGQLLTVLFSEFVALGALAGLAGLTLSVAGAWLLVSGDFGLAFEPAWTVVAGVWVGILVLTVLVGLVASRGLLSRPPLTLLAEAP